MMNQQQQPQQQVVHKAAVGDLMMKLQQQKLGGPSVMFDKQISTLCDLMELIKRPEGRDYKANMKQMVDSLHWLNSSGNNEIFELNLASSEFYQKFVFNVLARIIKRTFSFFRDPGDAQLKERSFHLFLSILNKFKENAAPQNQLNESKWTKFNYCNAALNDSPIFRKRQKQLQMQQQHLFFGEIAENQQQQQQQQTNSVSDLEILLSSTLTEIKVYLNDLFGIKETGAITPMQTIMDGGFYFFLGDEENETYSQPHKVYMNFDADSKPQLPPFYAKVNDDEEKLTGPSERTIDLVLNLIDLYLKNTKYELLVSSKLILTIYALIDQLKRQPQVSSPHRVRRINEFGCILFKKFSMENVVEKLTVDTWHFLLRTFIIGNIDSNEAGQQQQLEQLVDALNVNCIEKMINGETELIDHLRKNAVCIFSCYQHCLKLELKKFSSSNGRCHPSNRPISTRLLRKYMRGFGAVATLLAELYRYNDSQIDFMIQLIEEAVAISQRFNKDGNDDEENNEFKKSLYSLTRPFFDSVLEDFDGGVLYKQHNYVWKLVRDEWLRDFMSDRQPLNGSQKMLQYFIWTRDCIRKPHLVSLTKNFVEYIESKLNNSTASANEEFHFLSEMAVENLISLVYRWQQDYRHLEKRHKHVIIRLLQAFMRTLEKESAAAESGSSPFVFLSLSTRPLFQIFFANKPSILFIEVTLELRGYIQKLVELYLINLSIKFNRSDEADIEKNAAAAYDDDLLNVSNHKISTLEHVHLLQSVKRYLQEQQCVEFAQRNKQRFLDYLEMIQLKLKLEVKQKPEQEQFNILLAQKCEKIREYLNSI